MASRKTYRRPTKNISGDYPFHLLRKKYASRQGVKSGFKFGREINKEELLERYFALFTYWLTKKISDSYRISGALREHCPAQPLLVFAPS